MTYTDQVRLAAPTASGELGLFNTITGDTLHRGDWSFGAYYQDYDLQAAPARAFAPLTARSYKDMGYDLYRFNASIGYGLTDRWDVSVSLPFDRLQNHGNDRAGYINGWRYVGRFSDSGVGDVHVATKIGLLPTTSTSRLALTLFADLPTGEDDSGISTGRPTVGAGLHWTGGIWTLGGQYAVVGDRKDDRGNIGADFEMPNELRLQAGANVPLTHWATTNWISEFETKVYQGGDVKPRSPLFLVTGLRHWFGDSGWALNAGVRWNAAKFGNDHSECRVTELDDCGLGGLIGLTFAPMHLTPLPPPPPPVTVVPPPPPPPPTPEVVVPPPAPVVPPHMPTELRTDEIHFEPASARLTNIAKAILDDVALRMKQEPSATAVVIGYNDDKENLGANKDLDRRRAEAVRDYLVSRHGIDPSRISVEARDGQEPIGDNTTAEGRLRNRRVVIKLILP